MTGGGMGGEGPGTWQRGYIKSRCCLFRYSLGQLLGKVNCMC